MRLVILVLAVIAAPAVHAATIPVSPGQSIQAAIDAATTGDTIVVAAGHYPEVIDFKGKGIVVRSVSGPSQTTIDAAGVNASVVVAASGAAPATLEGFTIMHGTATTGAGIQVGAANLTVRRCIIRGNTAVDGGGVACANLGTLKLEDCRIEENVAANRGGGAHLLGIVEVVRSTFSDNVALDGGGISCGALVSQFSDCSVFDNTASARGGGIFFHARVLTIDRCRIGGNRAADGGGIHWVHQALGVGFIFGVMQSTVIDGNFASVRGGGMSLAISGSGMFPSSFPVFDAVRLTLVNNRAPTNGAIYFVPTTADIELRSSIVWDCGAAPVAVHSSIAVTASDVEGGYPGPGNLSVDPSFVSAANGDWHLRFDSPCIDVGSSASPAPAQDFEGDAIAGAPDMGADEFRRRLYVTGDTAPAGQAVARCVGIPGDPVLFLIGAGLASQPLPIPPYGDLLIALPFLGGTPTALRPLDAAGTTSAEFVVPHFLAGSSLAAQCLIGPELSNAVSFDY